MKFAEKSISFESFMIQILKENRILIDNFFIYEKI